MCWAKVKRGTRGFSLVELLVVIAIVAVLAGILLPVLARVKTKMRVANARREMQGLIMAINDYARDYSRQPCSPAAEKVSTNQDLTFAIHAGGLMPGGSPIENGLGYEANNSEIVTILLGVDRAPNANHVRNPRKARYWEAKMVTGPNAGVSTEDYVARDPWGTPYIITLDMNDDNRCRDAFYRRASVTERKVNDNVGFFGLSRAQAGDNFEVSGTAMIWSLGPDRSYNSQEKANTDLNRDNVLSWAN